MAGYIFDATKGETPEGLARRRALLDSMGARALSNTPRNLGEGLTSVAQALMYRSQLDDLAAAEQSSREYNATALSSLLGGGGSAAPAASVPLSAVPPSASAAPASSGVPSMADQNTPYAGMIREAAAKYGHSPDIALKVAGSEGGTKGWIQSGIEKNGRREPSYGPFQTLIGGGNTGFPAGMGNDMLAAGIDPRKPSPEYFDYIFKNLSKTGYSPWYGAPKVGVGKWDGVNRGGAQVAAAPAPVQVASADPAAAMAFAPQQQPVASPIPAPSPSVGGVPINEPAPEATPLEEIQVEGNARPIPLPMARPSDMGAGPSQMAAASAQAPMPVSLQRNVPMPAASPLSGTANGAGYEPMPREQPNGAAVLAGFAPIASGRPGAAQPQTAIQRVAAALPQSGPAAASTPATAAVQQVAQAVASPSGGIDQQRLMRVLADPRSSDTVKSIATLMYKQQAELNDPDKALDREKTKLELERLRNPKVDPYTLSPGQVRYGPNGEVLAKGGIDTEKEAEKAEKRANQLRDDTSGLRKEIQQLPSYKNYSQAAPLYKSMVETAGRNTKASDLNLVYGLGKIMDPGSVVREGEMVMVQNTSSLPDWLQGAIGRVSGGAGLTPETRERILTEAYGRMKGYQESFDSDAGFYRGIVGRNAMNEADVIPSFGKIEPWVRPKDPASAPSGAPMIPAATTTPRAAAPSVGRFPTSAQKSVPAPSGVDQKIWDHMTPEERSLWK